MTNKELAQALGMMESELIEAFGDDEGYALDVDGLNLNDVESTNQNIVDDKNLAAFHGYSLISADSQDDDDISESQSVKDLAEAHGYTCNFDENGYDVTAANNEDDAALAEAFGYDDTCFNGTTSEVVENRAAVDASEYGYGRETDSSCDDKDLAAEFGYGSDGPNDFSDGMVTNSSQNSSDDASTDVSSNDDERTECDGSTSSSNGTSCESDFSSDSTGDGSDYSSADGDNSSSDGG